MKKTTPRVRMRTPWVRMRTRSVRMCTPPAYSSILSEGTLRAPALVLLQLPTTAVATVAKSKDGSRSTLRYDKLMGSRLSYLIGCYGSAWVHSDTTWYNPVLTTLQQQGWKRHWYVAERKSLWTLRRLQARKQATLQPACYGNFCGFLTCSPSQPPWQVASTTLFLSMSIIPSVW